MATVTNKLSPAQVAIACALYQREIDLGKHMPVPEKDVLLGTFNSHTMKGDQAVPDAFDYIILTYEV
jgi:hypothetical protein